MKETRKKLADEYKAQLPKPEHPEYKIYYDEFYPEVKEEKKVEVKKVKTKKETK